MERNNKHAISTAPSHAAEPLLNSSFGMKSALIEVIRRVVHLRPHRVRRQSFDSARVAVLVVVRLNQGQLLKTNEADDGYK